MRVLVAEDDRISAKVLTRTLIQFGAEPTLATTGEEAWALFQTGDFQLVISDWVMPGMSGLELCEKIREAKGFSYSYVVLLTSRGSQEDRFRAIEAGADDFLVKPLDRAELQARLHVASRILGMQQEMRDQATNLIDLQESLAEQNAQLNETLSFLAGANSRFSDLFQGLPIACFTFDEGGRIQDWNQACQTVFGWSSQQVFEQPFWKVICNPEDVGHAKLMVRSVFEGKPADEFECSGVKSDKSQLYLLRSTFPRSDQNGNIVGAICANIDITERHELSEELNKQFVYTSELNLQLQLQEAELREANERLALLATVDGLTGLKNHRYFREMLDTGFVIARRSNRSYSVMLLDVDLFKQYNDTFGHPEGDDVLKIVGQILMETTRRADLVARYGGEEFVMLLPDTDSAGAEIMGDRVRKAIEAYDWKLRPITVSVGVATLDEKTAGPSNLVDAADKALYAAKRCGRNFVVHANSLEVMECIAA
jgi:two-component system cell cycle response regulator